MLHICLVIFISFISYTTVHLSISYTKVQLIHSVIHFHLIHFTDHSPSHSHSQYLVSLTMHRIHRIPNSLYLLLFSQSRLWKLGVSIDKKFLTEIYTVSFEDELGWYYNFLLLQNNHNIYKLVKMPSYLVLYSRYIYSKFHSSRGSK